MRTQLVLALLSPPFASAAEPPLTNPRTSRLLEGMFEFLKRCERYMTE